MPVKYEYAWHIHHHVLLEDVLKGGLEKRREYIKKTKPIDEINLRLYLLRPANITFPISAPSLEQQHSEQCDPNCPWELEYYLDNYLTIDGTQSFTAIGTILTTVGSTEYELKNHKAPWRENAS